MKRRILKIWSRLLRRRQQPERREPAASGPDSACFEAWIRAYRQRLDNGRGRR